MKGGKSWSNLAPFLQQGLKRNGIVTPTEIQAGSLTPLLQNRNTLLTAPTGTGKTLSYLLPLLHKVSMTITHSEHGDLRPDHPIAAILTPNRELGYQMMKTIQSYTELSMQPINTVLLSGGSTEKKKRQRITADPYHIVVGTPGTLIKMKKAETFFTSDIETLVIDEADTLFGKGFYEDIQKILVGVKGMGAKRNQPRQFIPVTATLPTIAYRRIMKDIPAPISEVHANGLHRILPNLEIEWHRTRGIDKLLTLTSLIKLDPYVPTIVFCNTIQSSRAVEYHLREQGIRCAHYHGKIPASDRSRALNEFVNGKHNVLVATDVASRGLDTVFVDRVIQFDMAYSLSDFLHRSGRTARMNRQGKVVTLVHGPGDKRKMKRFQADLDGAKPQKITLDDYKKPTKKDPQPVVHAKKEALGGDAPSGSKPSSKSSRKAPSGSTKKTRST